MVRFVEFETLGHGSVRVNPLMVEMVMQREEDGLTAICFAGGVDRYILVPLSVNHVISALEGGLRD